jgi:insulysin
MTEWDTFLSSHGGDHNAFTGDKDTVFHFECNQDGFERALDMMSHFFIDPLLDINSLAREINAVDSEFSKNKFNDDWRRVQVMRSTSNRKHPFHKFSTGNIESLNQVHNLREVLVKFYNERYSASRITAVLMGPQERSELAELAKSYLGAIPERNTIVPSENPRVPVREDIQLGIMYEIAPVGTTHKLEINWIIPNFSSYYEDKRVE